MKLSSNNGEVTVETELGSFVFDLPGYLFEFEEKDITIDEVVKVKKDKRRIGGYVFGINISIQGLSKFFILDKEQAKTYLELNEM